MRRSLGWTLALVAVYATSYVGISLGLYLRRLDRTTHVFSAGGGETFVMLPYPHPGAAWLAGLLVPPLLFLARWLWLRPCASSPTPRPTPRRDASRLMPRH